MARAARYAPLGERGMYGFGPHTGYRSSPITEHMASTNAQVHVTVMLESRRAFERLDEIAQDLGVLGTPDQHAVIDDHRRRLVEAARRHGKAVAMLTDSVEGVRQMIALGATLVNYASDTAVLRSTYASVVASIRGTR